MKNALLFFCLCFTASAASAQQLYFPPLTGNTWETVTPASLGWCEQYLDSLDEMLDNTNSKAFIILKDGKIAHEKYFDAFTQDSIWYWASAGKSLTAFLVGLAQEQGHLNIHDKTSDYLGTGWSAVPPAKEDSITIWHQLTMTSGLDDGVPENFCTLDTCLQYMADAGTRWAYHNGVYHLLHDVIEEAKARGLSRKHSNARPAGKGNATRTRLW